MRKEYDKLVRDRIPEIIQRDGRHCGVEKMDEQRYVRALKEKLIEEAHEIAAAKPQSIVTELADLYEVVDSLMIACNIDRAVVLAEQQKRRHSRGGFKERIRLLWTEQCEDAIDH